MLSTWLTFVMNPDGFKHVVKYSQDYYLDSTAEEDDSVGKM